MAGDSALEILATVRSQYFWKLFLMARKSPPPNFDPIAHNTEAMLAFDENEQRQISLHQRYLEYLSEAIGSPSFLALTVCFVAVWIVVNLYARLFNSKGFDQSPFPILQDVVSLSGLLVTIIVLIKQNRLEKMQERRAHLEMQVTLLTEQKATKLIELVEELRRDLPMIKDRYDAQAEAYQVPTDPEAVLKALDERKEA